MTKSIPLFKLMISKPASIIYMVIYLLVAVFLYKDNFVIWAKNPGDILAVFLAALLSTYALYKGFHDIREKATFTGTGMSILSVGEGEVRHGSYAILVGIVEIILAILILLMKFITPSLF
jgi:hypothetical protein